MKRLGICLIITLLAVYAKADIGDTVIAIKEVETKGIRFGSPTLGAKIITIDTFQLSINQMNSLAELLNQQSSVNLASYGPGGLATMSIRGSSPDHTTVIWNGLNIKPPMSGELNLSAINAGIFDQVSIQPGGSSTMYGSGAAAGVVYLSNKLKLSNSGFDVNAGIEIGSAQTKGLTGGIKYTTNNFGTYTGLAIQSAENNFKFINTDRFGDPLEKQEHAAFNTISFIQQNSFKFKKSITLETDIWYAHHFKEIPSLTSSLLPGQDEQTDENLHMVINAAKYSGSWFVKYRAGLMYYTIDFLGHSTGDPVSKLNRSWSIVNELESKYNLSASQVLFLGLNLTNDYAKVTDYSEDPIREKVDLFGRYNSSLFKNFLRLNFEARQAMVDGDFLPLIYAADTKIKTIKGVFLKGSCSKLYNLPDLNDLYWDSTGLAAGNPNLAPEYGWNIEGGLLQENVRNNFSFQHELTIFRNKLFDAIVWAQNNENIWIPDNYDRSFIKGLEFSGKYTLTYINSSFVVAYNYSYTDAVVFKENDGVYVGKPKRYVPKHKTGIRFQAQIKKFSSGIYTQIVDERPIDRAGNYLDPFFLIDLNMQYFFRFNHSNLSTYLKVKNILNTDYKLRAGYAQPLRSIYFGIIYKL